MASLSDIFSDSSGGGALAVGAGASSYRRPAAEERAKREAAEREEDRLRSWIQELRVERRRLEDQLLAGGPPGAGEAQQLRDELEKQVLGLSRQRDQLASELRELGATRAANVQLEAQVEGLRSALATEQDRVARYKEVRRSSKRVSDLDAALASANMEVQRLKEEVRAQAMATAEVRANYDVMQSANRQLQANMESQARETAGRLAAVQAQLESSQSDCVILRRQLEAAQKEAAAWRDKLKASEEAKADAARTAAAQQEAARRQQEAELAALQKQYESRLAAAEKQYSMLQRQYDAGLASSDVASEAAAVLRRERDALSAELQALKAELDDTRKDRADAISKLATLRTELRTTVDQITRDRDARIASASSQSEAALRDLRTESDRRVASLRTEYETRLTGLLETSERLRIEAAEAQKKADKYKSTVGHLKEQVKQLLLSRDSTERDLAAERSFNEELNRVLTSVRAELRRDRGL
ncbi:hypothetical protein GPECTOR_16g666 [Gonium pectorale]|uniref:Uncharacterized protein n=1 Tax=Gonium pectorale TaxID=33097 RepID=A0A150GL21_GONPE|nr:hypothetical protein GPECTOR_16g666 [Gonium pectorale]|eukprot:KXZ50491.1 hypothetical protein GPECTOR_16g666 [Gonium pectorale]